MCIYQRVRQQDVVGTSEPHGYAAHDGYARQRHVQTLEHVRQNGDDDHVRSYDDMFVERGRRSGGLKADGVVKGRRGCMQCSVDPGSGKAASARR